MKSYPVLSSSILFLSVLPYVYQVLSAVLRFFCPSLVTVHQLYPVFIIFSTLFSIFCQVMSSFIHSWSQWCNLLSNFSIWRTGQNLWNYMKPSTILGNHHPKNIQNCHFSNHYFTINSPLVNHKNSPWLDQNKFIHKPSKNSQHHP